MTETPEGEKRRKRTRTEGEGSKTRKKKEGGTVGKAKGKTPKMNHKSKEGLDSPEEKREKRTRKERKEKGSEKSQKKPREKKKPETNSNEDGEKPQTDVEKVQKDSSSKKERNSEKVKRKKRKEDANDETKKDTTKKKKERKPKEEKVKEDKEEEVVEDKEDNKNEKSDDDKTKKKDEKEKEKEEKEDKNEDKEDEEDDEEKPKEKKKDNEESEKKENTKTNPEKKEPKEMTTEDLMALAEQKKKEAQAANNKPRNLTPIQQPVEEVQKEKRRFFGFGKKKKVAVVGGVIAGSVKHEGHAGFSSDGGLSTQGLPPQLAEFFEKLDELIRSLGYEGVTQQEVKFILKEYGSMLIPAKKPAVQETKVEVQEPTDPSKMSFEELLREYNTQNAVLSGLKATHTSIGTAKAKLKEEVEELNMLLASERENLKKQIDKNTHLEVENARLRAGGSSGSDNSDAFQALEDKMKAKFDEMAEKLAKEQEKTKQLQAKLDSLTDEQSDLLAQLGESQERAKQSRQVNIKLFILFVL